MRIPGSGFGRSPETFLLFFFSIIKDVRNRKKKKNLVPFLYFLCGDTSFWAQTLPEPGNSWSLEPGSYLSGALSPILQLSLR